MKHTCKLIADFETINRDGNQCIWLWDVCNMRNGKHETGYNMESFINYILYYPISCDIYFHNLKFDGSYILDYSLKNGFNIQQTEKIQELKRDGITTIISGLGEFFRITFRNQKGKFINIYDSFKLLPLSAEKICKDFNLELKKGSIDYLKRRPAGYIPTKKEIEYCQNDTEIIKSALKEFFGYGFEKMTISSNAYEEFKKSITKTQYNIYFGDWEEECNLGLDKELRLAYRGGFCMSNPKYTNKTIKQTCFYYDVNSLYPYIMHDYSIPYGKPIYYSGKYETDSKYPYYIQKINIAMKVKNNGIPCILYKYSNIDDNQENSNKIADNYIYDTEKQCNGSSSIQLTVTNFDLELIFKNYEIYDIEYIEGWKFKVTKDMFNKYVDKFMQMKENATIEGNESKRTIAKLFLNALYGKFGQNPIRNTKIPYYDKEERMIKYVPSDDRVVKRFKYLPVAIFITSLGRYYIINTILSVNSINWIYSDTDSIVLLCNLEQRLVHDTNLGKFALENVFRKFKVLGQKCYYGITKDKKHVIKIAGCFKKATKNFKFGKFNYYSKNTPYLGGLIKGGRCRLVTQSGGKGLVFGDFTIIDKRLKSISLSMKNPKKLVLLEKLCNILTKYKNNVII